MSRFGWVITYELESSTPDYLVLDALGSRIKVDLEGYVLDEDGVATAERIFDAVRLREIDELHDYTSQNMWEAKFGWVQWVLESDFPAEKKLYLYSDAS